AKEQAASGFLAKDREPDSDCKGSGQQRRGYSCRRRCGKFPLPTRLGAGKSAGDCRRKGGALRQRGSLTDGSAGGLDRWRKDSFVQGAVSPGMDGGGRNPGLRVADEKGPRGAS